MGLTRIGTSKLGSPRPACILVLSSGAQIAIAHAQLASLRTTFPSDGDLEDALQGVVSTGMGEGIPGGLFIHVNRDGSLALATGVRPDVWPEDE